MRTCKIITGIECTALMDAVDQCKGNVLLKTARGDVLDLKSEISRFVFLSAFGNVNLMFEATLVLSDDTDYACVAKCVVTEHTDEGA